MPCEFIRSGAADKAERHRTRGRSSTTPRPVMSGLCRIARSSSRKRALAPAWVDAAVGSPTLNLS